MTMGLTVELVRPPPTVVRKASVSKALHETTFASPFPRPLDKSN
jgi:hypothetical protein